MPDVQPEDPGLSPIQEWVAVVRETMEDRVQLCFNPQDAARIRVAVRGYETIFELVATPLVEPGRLIVINPDRKADRA